MPRLNLPDSGPVNGASGLNPAATANSIASGAALGKLRSQSADVHAESAKLGEMQSTQGAAAMAGTARVGQIQATQEAQAAANYADIGQSATHLGQEVMAQGTAYFEKASGAIDDAIYNNSYADASKEFQTRVSQRLAKPTNDDGTPNFSTLQTDIDSIGSDVYNKYGAKIGSPGAHTRFQQSFSELTSSQSLMAMKQARDQQIQYSQASLQTGVTAATTNALSGSREMLPQFIAQGNAQIDSALKNGYITPEEAVNQREKLRKDINVGWMQIQNQKDPVATNQMLQNNSDKDLGITPMEHAQLNDANRQQLEHQQVIQRQKAAEAKSLDADKHNFNKDELDMGITKGTISEAQITEAYNKGEITHAQRADLTIKYANQQKTRGEKTKKISAVSDAMSRGEVLQGNFSVAEVNNHYKNTVASVGGNVKLFSPNDPTDKARIAARYTSPVPGFNEEIAGTITAGTPQQVMEAIKAYQYVQQKNPLVVSTMDAKTQGFITMAGDQLKYTKEDPGVVIANAKKAIYDPNPTIQEERKKAFSSEDAFKSDKINDTVKSMYEDKPWFGKNTTMPDEALPIIKGLLQQNYAITGNAKDAMAMTKSQTEGIVGASTINNNKQVMILPPENTYPQYNFDVDGKPAMRLDVEHSVTPYLKDGDWAKQAGVSPEDVGIQSYYGTGRNSNASYVLVNNKTQQPLINPDNGQPLTWSPDGEYIKTLKVNATSKAKQEAYQNDVMSPNYDLFKKGQTASPNSATGTTEHQGMSPTGLSSHHSDAGSYANGPSGPVSSSKIIGTALGYLGYSEHAQNGALHAFMQRSTGQSLDPSKTPWCAGFVNAVLASNGVKGSGSLSAQSLLNVGTATTQPQKGDIVILNRGDGKGHVGFYMGRDEQGRALMIGGNQGDMVSIKAYNESNVMGYRRPPGADELPQIMEQHNMVDGNKALPIGVRQNNPGNLVKTGEQWQGEIASAASRFKEFSSPEDGIAGIVRSIMTKYQKRGTNTLENLIKGQPVGGKRVGAYSETDQEEYVKNLSKVTGLAKDQQYDIKDMKTMFRIITGIIKQENGYNPYNDDVINDGIKRAVATIGVRG